jgi:uncharacterized cupredoxin-like copper-binding protein
LGLFFAVLLTGTLLAACGDGEDRPDVDTIDGGTNSSSSSSSSSSSASGEPAQPGVVEAKPSDATQVDVTLKEWAIIPSTGTVKAGKIYFLVSNDGPEDPHEFVVVKSDKAANALPLKDHKVPEDDIDLVDEIEPFSPNSKASITLTLEKGKYLFICNITELENGETESHYEEGMRVTFTVE